MDLCNIGSTPLIVGFANGLDVSMVYVHKIVKDSECLAVRNDSGIATLKDLKGKRIGCPFNTSVHFALLSAIKTVGLTAKDVTLVNLRPDAIVAAWQRKDIDAAYIWNPVLAQCRRTTAARSFSRAAILFAMGTIIFDGIVCRNAFKKEHPDLVLAYLKELDRINKVYQRQPADRRRRHGAVPSGLEGTRQYHRQEHVHHFAQRQAHQRVDGRSRCEG